MLPTAKNCSKINELNSKNKHYKKKTSGHFRPDIGIDKQTSLIARKKIVCLSMQKKKTQINKILLNYKQNYFGYKKLYISIK